MPKTLEEYANEIKTTACKWCGNTLPTGPENIQNYNHDDGWEVVGFHHRQWLYIECSICKYQWALWKLGVPR